VIHKNRQISLLMVLGCVTCGLWLSPIEAATLGDEQDAFNGYVIAAPVTEYPSLKRLSTRSAEFVKEVGEYENPGEALTLNGVAFLKVRYRFADQQLESIQLVYEGRDNRDKLVQWLEAQYGTLTSYERKMVNQVQWRGNKMAIALSYNPHHKQGTLWIISPQLNHLLDHSIGSVSD
jgi:hypothetical protein